MTRRCLICANINPCREHSEADQQAELARNDREIAAIRAEEAAAKPKTRLELLERVNELNMRSDAHRYWTCTVLYNTVIWKQFAFHPAQIHETIEGVLK